MSSQSPRRGRVAKTLQVQLAEMLRNLKDPRIAAAGPLSVNHVDVNRDLSVAIVYVSFIGGDAPSATAAVAALEGASPRLRGPLARRLNLRRAPELRFVADSSVEFNAKLAEIVAEDAARSVPEEGSDQEGQRGPVELSNSEEEE